MLLTPLPGARDHLLANLETIRHKLSNARSTHTDTVSRHKDYLDAIRDAALLLRGQVRPADIDELLHSRRYWALVDMTMTRDPAPAVVNDLLSLEIDDRLYELDAAIATTREALARWSPRAGHLVLPDTGFYLTNPRVLKNIDFPDILDTDDTITVLFPLVVIEELDRAKRRNDAGRQKAQMALAVLERHVTEGLSGQWLEAPTSKRRTAQGAIWFDVILDPPGHAAQADADAEIIDRAVAAQILAGREVTLLTYDTSQTFRARNAGIARVRKLEQPQAQKAKNDPTG